MPRVGICGRDCQLAVQVIGKEMGEGRREGAHQGDDFHEAPEGEEDSEDHGDGFACAELWLLFGSATRLGIEVECLCDRLIVL